MKRELIIHCLNWRLNDIVTNLKAIAGQGFTMIQVSPMQQHKEPDNPTWWLAYQITNFKIGNRLGTEEDIRKLCSEANKLGIKVIVDVVFNHVANDGYGKDYIPFDLRNPLHRDYLRQKGWVRNFRGVEHLITMITDSSIYTQNFIDPDILLRDWTFLDGEPCGVEKVNLEKGEIHDGGQ